MNDQPAAPQTTATGIEGAVAYADALRRPGDCWVCGGDMDAPRTRPVARALPGVGVVQACSATCAADARFAGRLVLVGG